MRFVATPMFAIIVMAVPLASSSAGAQTLNPNNSGRPVNPATLASGTTLVTAKERLSEKWNDEQRVDNCKVPVEKRGVKPRPDGCEQVRKD